MALLQQWATAALCVLFAVATEGKVCVNVSVQNKISNFETYLRNCTVVAGYLRILLIENVTMDKYETASFPELTEIKGHVIIYRLHGLTTLGRLFPNLSVIWGQSLFLDYALVIYDMPQLQEIGLRNLRRIARGSTRIDRCPHLCYVKTLDWQKIGGPSHHLHYFDTNEKPCKNCTSSCNGFCWNQHYCQGPDTCDSECIGCTGPTANDCLACRFYRDRNRCVSECPQNKLQHSALASCVTEEECPKLLAGRWFAFNKECRKSCPRGHVEVSAERGWCVPCQNDTKECNGMQVDSIAAAQTFRGCTHINGSLSIRVSSKAMAAELEENLECVREIDGHLRIHRSHSLTSLEFLRQLSVIHGNILYNYKYALAVFENQNLYKLWNWNVSSFRINNGTILFHYNSQLCLSEIKELAVVAQVNYTEYDVSVHSNGDKRACNYVDLNVTTVELMSPNITFVWDEFVIAENSGDAVLLGYQIYYMEDPDGNVTIYDEGDECNENRWMSIFVNNATGKITKLNANTQHAYYIKARTWPPHVGGQTHIRHFITPSDDPSEPLNVKTVSLSSNSVLLTWSPPAFPNGVLSHYVVVAYFQPDDADFLSQRDYCEFPPHWQTEEVTEAPAETWPNSTADEACSCQDKSQFPALTFNSICGTVDELGAKINSCKNYMYYSVDNSSGFSSDKDLAFVPMEEGQHRVKRSNRPTVITEEMINDPNATSYVVQSLKHFSMYIFLLTVCNTASLCSSPVMASQRTIKKDGADDIPSDLTVHVDNDEAVIKWEEPPEPNSVVVAYHVEHKRTDLEHSKAVVECIMQKEYAYLGYRYRMSHFLTGYYSVRVQAVSLAGIGKFSEAKEFDIGIQSKLVLPISFSVAVILVLALATGVLYYYRYKKRKSLDRLRLLTGPNSNYTGSDYIEDEWEIERDDIEIYKELGQGTFGMVWSGLIRSQNRPCAVKTINDEADSYEWLSFLNEASVMKSFSESYHVVKLLGVVSREKPPMVVMELMERGDLKSFLRQSRSSSISITCAEMYRMAAEIADGMAYLAAKKFVHRDLAARNCMVAADHTVKIGDFGMTRDIYATDYYRKDTGGLMPVRWMSPESLADGVFTSDSDVWSYGVVLWEIVTLAEQPYQGLANEQVLQFVTAQGTLERPLECPDLLYDIMEACWKWRPSHRPLFTHIVEKLESHIGQHFKLVSFYHSSEGEEFRMTAKDRVYNAPALTSPFSRNTSVYWRASYDDLSF